MSRDVKERERVGKLCPICCCDYLRVKASIERHPEMPLKCVEDNWILLGIQVEARTSFLLSFFFREGNVIFCCSHDALDSMMSFNISFLT